MPAIKLAAYFEPTSIKETVNYLLKYAEEARLIAGGTDLLLEENAGTRYLIDMQKLGLNYIRKDEDQIRVGACTTIHDLEVSSIFKAGIFKIVAQAAHAFANRRIRNVATLGGNICSAVPSADMSSVMIALDSRVTIVGLSEERIVPLEEFFIGPRKTVLKTGELATELAIPVEKGPAGASFQKLGRTSTDIALVNVAVRLNLGKNNSCDDAKIVLGAVAPTPLRARKAERVLVGNPIDEAVMEKASAVASEEAKPIDDVRASARYRKAMTRVLVKRALKEALINDTAKDVG